MLDTQAFWRDDEKAHENNCFARSGQIALGLRMSGECVYAELGVEGNPWVPEERERSIDLYRRYNDKAERIVGKRLLNEEIPPEDASFPYVKRIGEVFGSRYVIKHYTEWLDKSVDSPQELEKTIERVRKTDMREFMLPDNWEAEKKRIYEKYGLRPPVMRHIRGPVTLACSLMGSEEFIMLCLEEEELARKFSDTITCVILKMAKVMDEEAGVDAKTRPGFSFADDCSCLMTPEMYEMFGYPILKKVFEVYSPGPHDMRYQHSDSAMGHLLPILGRLDLNGVNFGPTVLVPEIRKYLPHARIDGCLSPLDLMRNDTREITRQVKRDIEDGFACGGVNITTAGSVNNGSSLESMRLIMELIQENRR